MFSKKEMIKIMIPLILEQMLNTAVGMADTLMVSSIGESAISGVSLVDNINALLFTLLFYLPFNKLVSFACPLLILRAYT